MLESISPASTFLAFFIVAASPGPATVSNATIAMRHGRKIGLIYGAGLSFGLSFWGLIAASGMGAVLQSSLHVLMILKVLGGLYLLWLAFLSARSALQPESGNTVVSGKQGWFLQGLILNMSNPKAVLAWMAALAVGLGSNDGVYALVNATTVCAVIGFVVYALYSVLFSIGGVMRWYRRCHRWINGAVAGLFASAGFGLIRSAVSR